MTEHRFVRIGDDDGCHHDSRAKRELRMTIFVPASRLPLLAYTQSHRFAPLRHYPLFGPAILEFEDSCLQVAHATTIDGRAWQLFVSLLLRQLSRIIVINL